MTRTEFEDITTYYELEKCARDYDYFDQVFTDGLYTHDEFESRILDEAKYCDSLSDLRSLVDDIPSDRYDRYTRDDYNGSWSGTDDNDDTFDGYKDDLRSYMDDNYEWEDEPEEEEEEEEEPEEPAADGEAATDIMDIIHEIVDNYEIPEEPEEEPTPTLTEEEENVVAEELMKAFEEYCTTPIQVKEEEPEEDKVNLNELWEAC